VKNIVLMVVDTLRPDRLGCYGYDRPTSPHLDALADGGVVLDGLWSASNYTAPAFTSLFTGRYPHEHGVFEFTARARRSWIHAAMAEAGMRTGAVVSFRFFQHLLGDIWSDIEAVTDGRSFDYAKDLPLAVTAGGLEWLDRHATDGPFCLFLHYDGPHMPFRLPDEWTGAFGDGDTAGVDQEIVAAVYPQHLDRLPPGRWGETSSLFRIIGEINSGRRSLNDATRHWLGDRYDEAVRYNDAAIGGFLAGLDERGLAGDTVVAVLSDHGEAFLEHGSMGHGGLHVYEEIIRTVGIVRDPDGPDAPGTRVGGGLSQVELLPRLMQRAGLTAAVGGPVSAREWIPADGAVCESKAKVAVRQGDLKYVRALPNPALPRVQRLRTWAKTLLQREGGAELYDLAADPGERNDLSRSRREQVRDLERVLKRHLQTVRSSLADRAAAGDEERRRIEEEMKRLGYM